MNDKVPSVESADLIGTEYPHDSAHLHVAGEATYVDDIVEPQDTLYATVGKSSKPHARIVALDLVAVHAAPGVVAVLTAADIPGQNNAGPVIHDEPILAGDEVQYVGQPIFAVAACSVNAARRAALLAKVDYEDLPATLTIEDALARGSFVLPTERLKRGNAGVAIAEAPHRLAGQFRCGGQDHFYLEGQISLAVPKEDRGVMVYCETQHPGEIQLQVAHALGVPAHVVTVECRRMGGAFGGKETQATLFACVAAILARRTGRAVKLRVDRDDDM